MVWTIEIHEQGRSTDGSQTIKEKTKVFRLARQKEYTMGRQTSKGIADMMFSDRSISRDHAKFIVDYSTFQSSDSKTRPSLFFVETKARFDSFINGKPCGVEEIVTVPGEIVGAPAPRQLIIKLTNGQKQKILVPAGKKVGDRFPIQKKTPDMRYPLADGDIVGIGAHGTKLRIVWKPLIFCGSQLKSNAKRVLEKSAKKIGAHCVKSWSKDCTHLVMEKLTVTYKVLWALVNAKPIVTIQYAKALANDEAKFNIPPYESLPDEARYRPEVTTAHTQINSNQYDPDPSRSKLHDGIAIWVPEKTEYARIAEATGMTLHTAVSAAALQDQLDNLDVSIEKCFWLKKRGRNRKLSPTEKILSSSNLRPISEQQLIHSILCVEDLETAMLVEDASQIGSQTAHNEIYEELKKGSVGISAPKQKSSMHTASVFSAKESSKIPKSNPKPAATSARENIESETKAAETEASEVIGKLTKPFRASKHFETAGTAQTARKAIPRTSDMPPKVLKIEPEESISVQSEPRPEEPISVQSEPRPAARKPVSGQWTTRKKTPSKSLGPDEADDDVPDVLPEDSERKRPPRRKRAWQSVKSEPEPENPCKKRAVIEDSHPENSSVDIPSEGTRPENAPLTLPHVNAGGLTWVSKKSVPLNPVVIRDAETGEVIQRAIVEDFAVKCRPRPAPQPTSERPRYQGLDFKRFRKNEVHTSPVVIRCGDMQSETSSSNAVMTTLQEMFADDEHAASEASRLW